MWRYRRGNYFKYPNNANQLKKVVDLSNSFQGFKDDSNGSLSTDLVNDYEYDQYGNMTKDQNKNITTIKYNHLNLPTEINFTNNRKINYTYDAAGVKLKKVTTNGANIVTTDYLDGYQYETKNANLASSKPKLQFFPTAEGYVKAAYNTTSITPIYTYVYNYTDHLGNIRMSYTANKYGVAKKLDETHYYPFGLRHGKYNQTKKTIMKIEAISTFTFNVAFVDTQTSDNLYLYNGKELQEEFDLNWYDYGARNYQPDNCRWMSVDPLADQFPHQSPFSAMNNNPIFFTDPDGRAAVPPNWVEGADGNIKWDDNATSQATTQAGETYRGTEYRRFENIGSSTYNDVNYNSDKTITSTQRARPDADRIVTQPESIDWYHFGGGAPLTVDISKFNFTSSTLSIEDFKTNSQSVDFFNGWSNHPFSSNIIWRPARDETLSDVYGTIRLAIVNRSLGQVRVVTDDATGFFDVFNYSALGAVVGDRLRSNGNPTPFGFFGTGTGTIRLTTPKPIQPKFPTGPKW